MNSANQGFVSVEATAFDQESPAVITPVGQAIPFSSVSVIFPAFNEVENIEETVRRARETFRLYFDEVEVIVVNDGSTDGTKEVLDKLAAEHEDLKPVHHPVNLGYGAALRSGLYGASKELIFFSDSDLQFDLHEVWMLLRWIGGHDIVAGYRANRADPPIRKLNAWGWNMLVRTVLGVKIRDIDCAFKLFRREVFQTIDLQSVGAMINTEIFAQARMHEMRVREVPVSHYPRCAGTQSGANLRVIIKAFRELAVMARKLRSKPVRQDTLVS